MFKQISLLCKEWERFGQNMAAVDGSKFRAGHSKKNNLGEKKLQERKTCYEGMLHSIASSEIKEISLTDPDARLMAANNNGMDVSYNAQTVVDSKHTLIVDYDVINNPTDHGQLAQLGQRALSLLTPQI